MVVGIGSGINLIREMFEKSENKREKNKTNFIGYRIVHIDCRIAGFVDDAYPKIRFFLKRLFALGKGSCSIPIDFLRD